MEMRSGSWLLSLNLIDEHAHSWDKGNLGGRYTCCKTSKIPLSQRYFAREAESQDEMTDSDECKTAKTRSNTIASGEEGVRGRIEIELDPVVAGRGGDTLYSVLCDFVAGVVSSPPSSLFPWIMFSFSKSSPRLQEASRNSSRNLRLWTRRGGSIRAIFVISVGTITLLALTGLLIFLCFLFTATLNAVIVSLLVSLVAAGGFLAFFFSCLIAIYIGTLSIAAFAISITTISTIIAIMVATGWIGFFWVIWLVAKKSLGLTSQSVSKASSIISTYSKTRQAS
ncbi:uncharacterized protein LOC121997639 isoform X2 [Zingiber officinale]|uniref:uncharacterized protein LOC121997639 isoform X2 n=1 Tax=Zingiber officinale TaxID=94328 RepID=UPI001C4ACB0B|nr:uncharacterized protein LOC121997639 isoform X2 [Zingiber officinale]